MHVVATAAEFRALHSALPQQTAFVATMGGLHEGHLQLVRAAAATGLPVTASIFVNPLQFGPAEDFSAYPRTLESDLDLLRRAGVAAVFTPDESELYPEPQSFLVRPDPALADILEGTHRPGFFTGVATVVLKLFNIVRPRFATFGKKDFQQLRVVEAMVRQLALPVGIIPVATVREPDGLAMSSRNRYLTQAERAEAPALQATLNHAAAALQQPHADIAAIEREAAATLQQRGWHTDYIAIRDTIRLQPVTPQTLAAGTPLIVLAAARLGATRLIDNCEVERG